MSITSIKKLPSGSYWGLWEISESENELLQQWKFPLTENFKKFKIRSRRKEWLAGRLLLQRLVAEVGEPFLGIEKDEHQKPFLIGSNSQISISHTKGYAAAIVHPNTAIGIDIEKKNPKINRIIHKFLNEQELLATQQQEPELLTYWCAKEAMYKLNGRKGMIFKEQILVEKEIGKNQFKGQVLNTDLAHQVNLSLENFGIYTVCIAEKQ